MKIFKKGEAVMTEMYPAITRVGAEKCKAALLAKYPDAKVTIDEGEIPMWGSELPNSPTAGKTERGFIVLIERSTGDPHEQLVRIEYARPSWWSLGACPIPTK